jgi:hypothetical protein
MFGRSAALYLAYNLLAINKNYKSIIPLSALSGAPFVAIFYARLMAKPGIKGFSLLSLTRYYCHFFMPPRHAQGDRDASLSRG